MLSVPSSPSLPSPSIFVICNFPSSSITTLVQGMESPSTFVAKPLLFPLQQLWVRKMRNPTIARCSALLFHHCTSLPSSHAGFSPTQVHVMLHATHLAHFLFPFHKNQVRPVCASRCVRIGPESCAGLVTRFVTPDP